MYKVSKYNVVVPRFSGDSTKFLVFNTYSGSLCALDDKAYIALMLCDENHKDFKAMIDQGLVVDAGVDEFQKVVDDYNEYVFDNSPDTLQLTIAMTTVCNLHCCYCFENKCPVFMSDETMEDIVNYVDSVLSSNRGIKNLRVTWFGGEPLLCYDNVVLLSNELMLLCDSLDVHYSSGIITNGLLLSEDRANCLSKHGVTSVQITLDGMPSDCVLLKGGIEYDYDHLIARLPIIASYLRTNVRLNVCKLNLDGIDKVFHRLISIGDKVPYSKVYFSRIEKYSDGISDDDILNEDLFANLVDAWRHEAVRMGVPYSVLSRFPKRRKAYCGSMQKLSKAIGPDGKLYVCEHCIGESNRVIGNVKDGVLDDTEYNNFIKEPLMDKCKTCRLLPVCFGGCPANRVLYGLPVNCDLFEQTVKAELELMFLK